MIPLLEEMDSLGKKHQSLNKSVNEAFKKRVLFEVIQHECGDTDIDNLYKIDMANKYKNISYIIEILKCQDTLYVSRALKNSDWMLSDNQYCSIINPQYLHSKLFPCMSSTAINKLLYNIRLRLKDESRNEEFYKYYEKNNNFETAIKWLPNCSIPFVENVIEKNCPSLRISAFKHLCKRSFTVFEKYMKKYTGSKYDYLRACLFLLNTHCREYLNILQHIYKYDLYRARRYPVYFNKKYTVIILKHCPEVLADDFEKYYFVDTNPTMLLDMNTVAKYLGPDKIQDFLLTHAKNKKLFSWFTYKNLKTFIEQLSKKERLAFVKKVFIDNLNGDPIADKKYQDIYIAYSSNEQNVSNINVYRWYRYASFATAFIELTKLIKSESAANERVAILNVLTASAYRNMTDIHTLLKYFRDKHINEPFLFKINFMNNFLSMTNAHRFNEDTWKILDELFYNLGVYFDSDNNVQKCIECIIVYKILHNESIDKAVEKKLAFHTFDYLNAGLRKEDRVSIFKYVYSVMENKLNLESFEDEKSFSNGVALMHQMLNLLKQEEKNLIDYPSLLEKIKTFVEIKRNKDWSTDMNVLFNVNRSWRKLMFEESFTLRRGVDACLQALKYDPMLLIRRSAEVKSLRRDNKVQLDRVISKLRVYWPQTFAAEWADAYRTELLQPAFSRSVIRGLCQLLPSQELQTVLRDHAPSNIKIKWSEVDPTELSMQKYLAQTMYYARPPPPPDSVLQYAIGDYLQFTFPSLQSIFYTLCMNETRTHLPQFLRGSVSLQKCGIRLAFSKLKHEDVRDIFSNIWKVSKNKSLRALVFELTFKLLCAENDEQRIDGLWQLIKVFIDNLNTEENNVIYKILGKVDKVPISVRAQFCMKSYKILKSLPPKANCKKFINKVVLSTRLLMDTINPTFMAELIIEHINHYYAEKNIMTEIYYSDSKDILKKVVSAFVLHSDDEAIQMQRYDIVLRPILNHSIDMWKSIHIDDNLYVVKDYLKYLVQQMIEDTFDILLGNVYAHPVKIFKALQQDIERQFSAVEHYFILTLCRLTVTLIESCTNVNPSLLEKTNETDSYVKESSELNLELRTELWKIVAPTFSKKCVKLLSEDLEKYFPSIQRFFETTMKEFCLLVAASDIATIYLAREFMSDAEYIPAYLLAIKVLPDRSFLEENREEYKQCRKRVLSHPSSEVKMLYFRKFHDAVLDT